MGKNGLRSLLLCFGRREKVEDVPSPRSSSPAPSNAKPPPRRQRSNTRLSCSDLSNTTELSSLSSSLLGANLVVFTTAELKAASQGFSAATFIGEGGFGPVYRGYLDEKVRAAGLKPQSVAVKVLNLEGMQGHKEWLTEVILLGQLRHPHLVKLIGYCYEDKHRMLVYEYMARGSLENHLFKGYAPLTWEKRIKIAVGAAKGLAFLHGVDQPVIYRDFKASNILLDSEFKAKLSDFGLAKDGPEGDDTHVSTRVMGTHGYAAPEYVMTGHLTAKSDVYSFGVVLLELLTGRRSVDKSRPSREQNLVDWARPNLNNPRKLSHIIDPLLEGQYSIKGAQKAAELAYHCVSLLPKSRPHMSDVVELLEPVLEYTDIPPSTFVFTVKDEKEKEQTPAKPQKTSTPNRQEKIAKDDDMTKDHCKEVGKLKVHRRSHRSNKNGQKHRRATKNETQSDTALYRKPTRKHRTHGV